MSWRIEQTTEDFTLPEGALCFGPNGWIKEATPIRIEGAESLESALDIIWREQKGLLGFGEMVFYRIGGLQGFMVFHPEPDPDPTEDA